MRTRKALEVKVCTCSLVNQLRTVKEQALKDGNEDPVEQLVSIFDALTACVSSLHERNHETLIHEVLSTPIWKTCQVCLISSQTCRACQSTREEFCT